MRRYTRRSTDCHLIWHSENDASSNVYIVVCIHCPENVACQLYAREHIQAHRTEERDWWSMPLRWAQVPWYICQVSYRLGQAFRRS
jgi:hypothetical protein